MKILVTGASGYVGAKIYKDLKEAGHEVTGTYYSNKLFEELEQIDLTNQSQVKELFEEIIPDMVIHVAANASNGSCEEDPEGAEDLNVNSTKYLVDEAKKHGSKFIFISTFGAYNPTGKYGKTKVEAEKIVQDLDKYMILRPSLIIGISPNTQNDRPFNRFLRNIENRDEIAEYDSSWEFNVTFLSHLSDICRAIIEKEIFNNIMIPVASKGITSRYKIANQLLSELEIEVRAIDQNRSTTEPQIDWNIYSELGLPELDYDEGIKLIQDDIKDYIV